jgi:hypothetical protein
MMPGILGPNGTGDKVVRMRTPRYLVRQTRIGCAIIYATALAYNADLLTCDRHFKGLPNVHFVPKMGE